MRELLPASFLPEPTSLYGVAEKSIWTNRRPWWRRSRVRLLLPLDVGDLAGLAHLVDVVGLVVEHHQVGQVHEGLQRTAAEVTPVERRPERCRSAVPGVSGKKLSTAALAVDVARRERRRRSSSHRRKSGLPDPRAGASW